jgi:hypothetical protein
MPDLFMPNLFMPNLFMPRLIVGKGFPGVVLAMLRAGFRVAFGRDAVGAAVAGPADYAFIDAHARHY